MYALFKDRTEAGRMLAERLRGEAGPDVLVLALPRGGVPVAFEVAMALSAELDVLPVRKIGVPGQPELAMGAIASGEALYVDRNTMQATRVSQAQFDAVLAAERVELARRERLYRGNRQPIRVEGRTVVLVDDGIATGATMRAATASMRQQGAERIIIATPVCTQSLHRSLSAQADDIVCLRRPQSPRPISETYEEFPLVQEDEVCRLLRRAAAIPAPV